MDTAYIIRRARNGDEPQIIELARRTFHTSWQPLFLMTSDGYDRYMAEVIAESERSISRVFFVVADMEHDRVRGFAEWQRFLDGLHLNYIAIDSGLRGLGVGPMLLGDSVEAELMPNHRWVSLDVFDDNEGAIRWYRRLGFQQTGRVEKYLLRSVSGSQNHDYILLNLPEATRQYESFGYAEYQIRTETGLCSVRRSNRNVFHLGSPQRLRDTALLTALQDLVPTYDLVVDDASKEAIEAIPAESSELLAVSLRMIAVMKDLRNLLTGEKGHGKLSGSDTGR